MDIREFSTKLAEATRNMKPEEREAIQKMFQGVSDQITKTGTIQYNGMLRRICRGSQPWDSYSRRADGTYLGFEEAVYEMEAIHYAAPCKGNYKDL